MKRRPRSDDQGITEQIRLAREQVEAVNDRVNKRAGRNLPMAILVALVLGGIVLVSVVFVKELFLPVAVLLVAFALYELSSALRFAGRDVPRLPLLIGGTAVVPIAYFFGGSGLWFGVCATAAIVAVWRLTELALRPATRTGARAVVADVAAGVFCLAYVVVLGSFAVVLLSMPQGQWWLLAFLIVVVVVDTGALVSGVTFGHHKLAPRISPGKTWEGFIGAFILALAAGILLSLFMIDQPWWFGLIFGGLIAIASTVGDLMESLIKRDLKIKDISTILPGHGGFLDRLDSVLPSAAVALGLYQWVY